MARLSDREARRYVADPCPRISIASSAKPRIASASDAALRLADIASSDQEHAIVFYLDVRHRLIERRIIAIGSLTGVDIHPRNIFRHALRNNACAFILAHNHPSGDASPSTQDIGLTARMIEAGELLGIPCLDHVVVCESGYYVSVRELHPAMFKI